MSDHRVIFTIILVIVGGILVAGCLNQYNRDNSIENSSINFYKITKYNTNNNC